MSRLPLPISLPPGETCPGNYLRKLAEQGLAERCRDSTDEYRRRLADELNAICSEGHAPYFLLMNEIAGAARERAIAIAARGSASSSLVCYALGLSDVDPIEYGLLFERFFDPDGEMEPDINVVVDATRRDELLTWMKTRYGDDCVAAVLARESAAGIDSAVVAVSAQPLKDIVPVHETEDAVPLRFACRWDEIALEDVGVTVVDLLGWRALTLLAELNKTCDNPEMPLDDRRTYDLFAGGKTCGVPQFDDEGMKNALRRVRPDRFEDLCALNALYRPGPIKFIESYARRKHGREPRDISHPALDEILSETYGLPVYQEQVMLIANRIGGIPLGRAYRLIKAISKKNEEAVGEGHVSFIEGARKNALEQKDAEEVFRFLEEHAVYGFNKSHSVTCAMLAYKAAWFKVHHPGRFLAAVEKVYSGSPVMIADLRKELQRT